jgi:hypothetical protein
MDQIEQIVKDTKPVIFRTGDLGHAIKDELDGMHDALGNVNDTVNNIPRCGACPFVSGRYDGKHLYDMIVREYQCDFQGVNCRVTKAPSAR